MSKRNKRRTATEATATKGTMSIDTILEQLADLKEIAASLQTPRDDQEPTLSRLTACEAATAILTALQDEGIKDPDGVRDLVHDYNALAEQYRNLHQHYEVPEALQRVGSTSFCPKCHRRNNPGNNYCWICGKRLGLGR